MRATSAIEPTQEVAEAPAGLGSSVELTSSGEGSQNPTDPNAGVTAPAVAAVPVRAGRVLASPVKAGAALLRDDSPAKSPAEEADDLIKKHKTAGLYLDDATLSDDLIAKLPAGEDIFMNVMNKVNFPGTLSAVFAGRAGGKLRGSSERVRLRLIEEMVPSYVSGKEETAIKVVWQSFMPGAEPTAANLKGLTEVAARRQDLWKLSVNTSTPLVEFLKPVVNDFKTDVKAVALHFLEQNKDTVAEEAGRYGLNLKKRADPLGNADDVKAEQGYLEGMKLVAAKVLDIKTKRDALKEIYVGYDEPQKNGRRGPAPFRPNLKPSTPPLKSEGWPSWEQVNEQWVRATAAMSGFANKFPTIYTLLQQDKLDTLANASDSKAAQKAVEETLTTTWDKASEAEGMVLLETGIKYTDLQPIHKQLFGNAKVPGITFTQPWQESFFQDIVNDELARVAARDFWETLGLSMASAMALIAAPFTGGVTALILVGSALAIDAAQAAQSWEKYAALNTANQGAVRDELAIVSQGQVDSALVDAVINTLALFLDAYGGVGKLRSAAELAKAGEALKDLGNAEKALEATATKNKAIREAAKEGSLALGGAGVAVGAQALSGKDIPSPKVEIGMGNVIVFFGDAPIATPGGAVQPMRIQRELPPDLRPFAGEFEKYVKGAAGRGELGLPKYRYTFFGQHKSNQGIDIIGLNIYPDIKAIEMGNIECKFQFEAHLGSSNAGTQLSPGWNMDAAEKFFQAGAEREALIAEVERALGRRVSIDFLTTRLGTARPRVVVPNFARLETLELQLREFALAGHIVGLHPVPVPHTPIKLPRR